MLLLLKNQYHGPIKLNKNVLQTERALKNPSAKGPHALAPPGLVTDEVHLKIVFSPHWDFNNYQKSRDQKLLQITVGAHACYFSRLYGSV